MSLTRTLDFLIQEEGLKDRPADTIPLSLLKPDPGQPRPYHGIESEDPELLGLAENIRTHGIINPITVRKTGDYYLIISGERRYRAARMAGLSEVPCRILNIEDPAMIRTMQLSENIQREEMPLLATALAIRELLSLSGLKQKELALKLGKGEDYVSGHLLILKSSGEARKAIEEGLINSPYTYRLFNQLDEENQHRLLAKARRAKRPLSRSELMGLLGRNKKSAPQKQKTGSSKPLTLSAAEWKQLFTKLKLPLPRNTADFQEKLRSWLSSSSVGKQKK